MVCVSASREEPAIVFFVFVSFTIERMKRLKQLFLDSLDLRARVVGLMLLFLFIWRRWRQFGSPIHVCVMYKYKLCIFLFLFQIYVSISTGVY